MGSCNHEGRTPHSSHTYTYIYVLPADEALGVVDGVQRVDGQSPPRLLPHQHLALVCVYYNQNN